MIDSVDQAFFQIKRNKAGALIVSVNTDVVWLPGLGSINRMGVFCLEWLVGNWVETYQALDAVTGKKTWLALGLALGLGVSMAGVIVRQPSTVGALSTPVVDTTPAITLNRIKIDEAGINVLINETGDRHHAQLYSAGQLQGHNQPLMIRDTATSDVLAQLDQVKLGQEIKIFTENSAYSLYTVTEIRQLKPDQITTLSLYSPEKLIVFTQSGFGFGEITAVIASPK